jgi:isopenicillin N synthase-like dioxygenase
VIDIAPLLGSASDDQAVAARARVISEIRAATQDVGFMYVSGHGVSAQLQTRLKEISAAFFKLPTEEKNEIAMAHGGHAWRGFFQVGDELTSGIKDQKEGIYFGSELPAGHPLPLHGPNLWPRGQLGADMREVVLEYIQLMQQLGQCMISF